jgi:hypothetical protein
MPFTLDQLDFLSLHVGVVIPPEFIENKRRAEEFKARREKVSAEAVDKPDGWRLRANFDDLLKRADDSGVQKQFDAALKLLDEAAQLLQQPDAPPAEPEASPEAAAVNADWEHRVSALTPRVVEAEKTRRGEATWMAMLDLIKEHVESGNFDKALQVADNLEAKLNARPVAKDASGSLVKYKTARLRWERAQAIAQAELEGLGDLILTHPEVTEDPRLPEIRAAVEKLLQRLPRFDGSLEDGLDLLDQATEPAARDAARTGALKAIDHYAAMVESATGLAQLEETPFGKANVRGELTAALKEIKDLVSA